MNKLKVIKCGLFLFIFALLKKDFLIFFAKIKLSYYWFNKQELLQKAKEKYGNGSKEKAAKYYQDNKDILEEKARNEYKNLSEKEKESKRQYSKNRYDKMKEKLG